MRSWAIAVLVATALLLASVVVAGAQGPGPVRSETLYAGGYRLRVDLYSDPPFTGRRYEFDVVVSTDRAADLRGLAVTASAVPDAGTNATAVPAALSPVASTAGGFNGHVTMGVRGPWKLHFVVNGALGRNAASLALRVAAPAEIPIWLAWAIGLSPLAFLLVFAIRQRTDLARLSREASPGSRVASTPPAT